MSFEICYRKINNEDRKYFETYPEEVEVSGKLEELGNAIDINPTPFIYNFFKEKLGERYWCLVTKEELTKLHDICRQVWSVDGRLWEIDKEKYNLSKQIEGIVTQMCDFKDPSKPAEAGLQDKLNELNAALGKLVEEETELSKNEKCCTLLDNSWGLLGKSYYDDDFYRDVKICIEQIEKMLSDYDEENETFLFDFSY